MKLTRAIVLAGALLTLAPPADGAMCIQWRSRTRFEVGATAPVVFETAVPTEHGVRPWPFPDYPFSVTATAPDGRVLRISVVPESRTRWRGDVTLDVPGIWLIASPNFPGDTPCGPVLRIVAGEGSAAPPLSLPLERIHESTLAEPGAGRSSVALLGSAAVVAGVIATLILRRHTL